MPTHYNINDDTYDRAASQGLEPIATGGNIDYMSRSFPNGHIAILSDHDDAGLLNEPDAPGCVTIYYDEEWQTGITFQVPTISLGINIISNMNQLGIIA